MVDILSGVLSGTGPGFMAGANVSHHFLAYCVDAFTDLAEFKRDMDTYLRGLRETPTAPGHERVLYAGLPDHEEEVERRAHGIPYHPDVIAYYRELAAELGLPDRMPGK
jgi:LDH2 family malate/lactate/ureidoglycolate dehydrogenase